MIPANESSIAQVMHKIEHNFDLGHTHESGYSPVIDTCRTTCPVGLLLAKSSTIMSYCHLCSGSYANMDYTFGGKYKGTGLCSDFNSYNNSALAGTISTEPHWVNAKMWQHISTRRACTALPSSVGVRILLNMIILMCSSY